MGRTTRLQSSTYGFIVYVLLWSGKNVAAARHSLLEHSFRHIHHASAAAAPVKVDEEQHIPQTQFPVISIVVGVVSTLIAVFLLALAAMGYFQNRCEEKDRRRLCRSPGSSAAAASTAAMIEGDWQPEKYTLRELQAATVSFTQKLGREGCAGAVFKGILSNSQEVAVKLVDDFTPAEFESEVQRVCALKHDHLIHILGSCTDGDHCLLVQEFYANGSLRSLLYATGAMSSITSMSSISNWPTMGVDKPTLNWSTRFGIALGTARAVAYVHGNCSRGMNIHGRIKPENILLTENLSPKLADFGFVRCRRKRDHDLTLATAQGTLEYFAPEWWSDPTPKCDVYSFGILLLEIVGGRRIGEFYDRPQWELPDLDEDEQASDCRGSMELLDPELKGKVDMTQLRLALRVAYWCIHYEARARPSMSQVVDYLEGRVRVPLPQTPSSSAIFTPLHLSYSASLEAFGFRAGSGVEIVKAR